MDILLLKLCVSAAITFGAAIGACAIDRFRNTVANILALGAGIVPWCVMGMMFHWSNLAALLVGASCGVSLYLFALLFYAADAPSMKRTLAITLAAAGMGASLYFSATVVYPFLVTA